MDDGEPRRTWNGKKKTDRRVNNELLARASGCGLEGGWNERRA